MAMPKVAIKKSLSTQRTGYGPMATKMDGNVGGHVEQQKILASSRWATVRGLQRRIAMLRIVLGPRNRSRKVAHGADWMGPDPPKLVHNA